jgi:hypothetical protein
MPAFLRTRTPTGWLCAVFVLVLASFRLAHAHVLWADEDYHLAAAINILHWKIPYRDFWYDKPPLSAFYYLLIGGHAGWLLRILDTAYVLGGAYLAFLLAKAWWGETEGRVAALLFAFFMTFYLPSAVIPFAADALMVVPHLAAIYCAFRNWPLRAGICSAVAFLANTKGVFVLATCAVWLWPVAFRLCLGFAVPVLLALAVALAEGSLPAYIEQVWRWGALYAKNSPVANPILNGAVRSVNWVGFHALLVLSSVFALFHIQGRDRLRVLTWALFSFAGTALGGRFAPHYFLQVLPCAVVLGSRGLTLAWSWKRVVTIYAAALLLLVPLVRFAPRYFQLGWDALNNRVPEWSDLVMDEDSQRSAALVLQAAHPQDTLFVWGYRPDLYVYTRMVSDTRFWDSQPLTGVPADRHLHATGSIYGAVATQNLQELAASRPTFVVDGLGPLNPNLAIDKFPALRPWLEHYRLIAHTGLTRIYKRTDEAMPQTLRQADARIARP